GDAGVGLNDVEPARQRGGAGGRGEAPGGGLVGQVNQGGLIAERLRRNHERTTEAQRTQRQDTQRRQDKYKLERNTILFSYSLFLLLGVLVSVSSVPLWFVFLK